MRSLSSKKRTKYKNVKTKIDGITFDSKAEAARYAELKGLQKEKLIFDLECHPKFQLMDGFRDSSGKRHREITYSADFSYIEAGKDGTLVVEDVKGVETGIFKLKKKLLLKNYPDIDFRFIPTKKKKGKK